MNCIHRNKLTEYNWCKVAGYYCTLGQQMTCDKKVVEKPLTNADRIRSMSDEELAVFLTSETKRLVHPAFEYFNVGLPEVDIYNNRLQWLRQPVKECE